MAGIKLQKRNHDFFVSYGHGDLAQVMVLIHLLKRVCGLSIWFDETHGNASVRSSELLGRAIGDARGAIFCLSEAWKKSSWCKSEFNVSLKEQRAQDGFEIVSVRLDDVEPPDWFEVAEILDLRQVSAQSIARLLRSLSSDTPGRFDNSEDVYLAAPWSHRSALAHETFKVLSRAGWRLIGDAPNLKHLGEKRIEAILRTTRGLIGLLPYDLSQPGIATSPYIVQEARMAIELEKPMLLLAEPGVCPPEDLLKSAFRRTAVTLAPGSEGEGALASVLDEFDEVLRHVVHDDTGAFIFFAASLREDQSEADVAASVIERSSNIRCVRGERLSGDNVQQAIIDLIRRAALMIADVSDNHRNTLIETGIAMGSGTKLRLICRAPSDGDLRKKAFMFEGQEVHWYRTSEERLCLCYRFARQFRRRIYVFRRD
jgi:TIR domain